MKRVLYIFAAAFLSISTAHADISINLDQPDQIGNPGDDLVFMGTIVNTGSDPVYLNSDSLNFTGDNVNFTVNDDFGNVPISLAGDGGSSGDIELFDIVLNEPFAAIFGSYTGNYSLLGGLDDGAQEVLNGAGFSVDAESERFVTPEPAFIWLLAGCLGLIMFRFRYRSCRADRGPKMR